MESAFRPQLLTHPLSVSCIFRAFAGLFLSVWRVPHQVAGWNLSGGCSVALVPKVCGTMFRARFTHLQLRNEPKFTIVPVELFPRAPPSLSLSLSHLPQHFPISWGSLFRSVSQNTKALVTSFCCIPPKIMFTSRTGEWNDRKRKRSMLHSSERKIPFL